MNNVKIRIGTSGRNLALWHVEYAKAELERKGVMTELVSIKTQDDETLLPGTKGHNQAEIKALEAALLRGEVDVAVYSMPDLPTTQTEGLVITAVSYRDDPADVLVLHRSAFTAGEIFKVKKGGKVGCSTRERAAQLIDYRPDIACMEVEDDILANLDKLRSGHFDALFLTAADLLRRSIDLSAFETVFLNTREFVPSPTQGVTAWQCNSDDLTTRRILRQIHHPEVSACTNIERRVKQLMGEELPLGVYCARDTNGNFHTFAACAINGEMRRAHISSSTSFGVAEKVVKALG